MTQVFDKNHVDFPSARSFATDQADGKDLRIIHDEQIARVKERRQIGHAMMGARAALSRNDEQTRVIAWLHGTIRHESRIEGEVKFRE
jgi:hypothetical protein